MGGNSLDVARELSAVQGDGADACRRLHEVYRLILTWPMEKADAKMEANEKVRTEAVGAFEHEPS